MFKLLLDEGLITHEIVEQMRSWQHSGFSVDKSVLRARLKITWAFAGEYSGLIIMVRKRSIS
ncbi:MAG: hypothetical protein WCP55_07820 [Lentisphaerota bacterium]